MDRVLKCVREIETIMKMTFPSPIDVIKSLGGLGGVVNGSHYRKYVGGGWIWKVHKNLKDGILRTFPSLLPLSLENVVWGGGEECAASCLDHELGAG